MFFAICLWSLTNLLALLFRVAVMITYLKAICLLLCHSALCLFYKQSENKYPISFARSAHTVPSPIRTYGQRSHKYIVGETSRLLRVVFKLRCHKLRIRTYIYNLFCETFFASEVGIFCLSDVLLNIIFVGKVWLFQCFF